MSLNYSFAGKKVLITGGGQGIGRQIVQRFSDGGASVFVIEKNPETVEQLKKDLPNITVEQVDITDWEATKKAIEGFGALDHLVNNAGIIRIQTLMEITKDSATEQIQTNLLASIGVTKATAKAMINQGNGGSIVNISSVAARFTSAPGTAIYSIGKAGVESLTRNMAREFGDYNIRANCIVPGMVNAPMLQAAASNPNAQAGLEALQQRLIIKRVIETNEIADLVLFLLSPLSSMINGESVVIDGGFLA